MSGHTPTSCACGVPGPEKERECHADYYGGETFAIDSGGEFKETNVCKCGCHRAGYTPEPWEIAPCCAEDDSLDIVSEYAPMPNGTVSANWIAVCEVTDEDDEGSWARNRANAARIVACVNALEGIEDPSAVKDVIAALRKIEALKPEEFDGFPADWSEQIASCSECQRYKGHPIQQGICNEHRRPLWDREKHDAHEVQAIGPRARIIARDALAKLGSRS